MAAEGFADSKRLKGPKRPWKDEELQMDAKDLGWFQKAERDEGLKRRYVQLWHLVGMLGLGDQKNMKTKKKQRTKTQLYKIVTTAQVPI